MKAAIYKGNKTFSVIDAEKEMPKEGEVRIKIAYCGVCGTDVHIYHGAMDQRVHIPQVIGHEMSGVIDAVGKGVVNFKAGEKVVVCPLDYRGEKPSDKGFKHIARAVKFMGIDTPGAFQEYWNVPAFTVYKLPENIDMKLAAMVEPISVACHDVRMGEVKADETVVVLGAGPIGLLVAMVARHKGANVIISEVNKARIKISEEFGFTVINPLETDLVEYMEKETNGKLADVVFEVSGVQASVDVMTKIAGIRSRIVMVAIHGQPKEVNLHSFFWKELKLIGARVYESEDYEESIKLVTEKALPFEKLITGVEPLANIQKVFEEIDNNPEGMKYLVDLSDVNE
jgi:2-desacetyl-2-hydroxyethyl bacteriochlorophyllide A dehydrogenase